MTTNLVALPLPRLRLRSIVWHGLFLHPVFAFPCPSESAILDEFRIRLESFKKECETTISIELESVENDIIRQQSLEMGCIKDSDDIEVDEPRTGCLGDDVSIAGIEHVSALNEKLSTLQDDDQILEVSFEADVVKEDNLDLFGGGTPKVDEEEGRRVGPATVSQDEKDFIVGETDEEEEEVLSRLVAPVPMEKDASSSQNGGKDGYNIDSNFRKANTPFEEGRGATAKTLAEDKENLCDDSQPINAKPIKETSSNTIMFDPKEIEAKKKQTKKKQKKKKKLLKKKSRRVSSTIPAEIQIDKHFDDDSSSIATINDQPGPSKLIIGSILRSIAKSIIFTVGLAMIIASASIMVKLTLEIIEESIKKKN